MMKFSIDRALRRAKAQVRGGRLDEARAIYSRILEHFPGNPRAQSGLKLLDDMVPPSPDPTDISRLIALYHKGEYAQVAEAAASLVQEYAEVPTIWLLLGAAERACGRIAQAERGFRQAAKLQPASGTAHRLLGHTLRDLGRMDEAITSFQAAMRHAPQDVELLNLLGLSLKDAGRAGLAVDILQQAVALAPQNAILHSNLGLALRASGRLDEAVASYRHALSIDPEHLAALCNLGNVLQDRGELDEAADAYRRALDRGSRNAEVLNNLGTVLKELGQHEEAVKVLRGATRIAPTDARIHYNLGTVLSDLGQEEAAAEAFERALEHRPGYGLALGQLLRHRAQLCDWRAFAEFERQRATLGTDDNPVDPFAVMAFEDDPERQAMRAIAYARRTYREKAAPLTVRSARRPDRLRVGYFSADFHEHAVLHLMSGLLREHDTARFEIYAFSYALPGISKLRDQATSDVEHFIDIHAMNDRAVVDLARQHDLDIAIDCNGYTQHSRLRLFASRLAPIQVSYLGYPGTLGVDFIDYIVADPIVIPASDQRLYREKVLYLPGSYQPNDAQRAIANTANSRSEVGLPGQGFVLACFNQTYKIGPREFDIWMRVLWCIPGSVLWLLDANREANDNLRGEAHRRGIDPARLIFAPRLAHDEHLARHRHADLFVDTFAYNAHTTASDALWAGLPLVTRLGRQFSARVGASLLHAVGLPELVAASDQEYEALILELASDGPRLAAIRAKLASNRLTTPLFDTVGYTRGFEAALDAAYTETASQHRA